MCCFEVSFGSYYEIDGQFIVLVWIYEHIEIVRDLPVLKKKKNEWRTKKVRFVRITEKTKTDVKTFLL